MSHAICSLANSRTDVFDIDYHKIMSFVTPSYLFKQSASVPVTPEVDKKSYYFQDEGYQISYLLNEIKRGCRVPLEFINNPCFVYVGAQTRTTYVRTNYVCSGREPSIRGTRVGNIRSRL